MDKITSLVEAREAFPTQERCERHLREMRWPDGVTCPRCGSKRVTYYGIPPQLATRVPLPVLRHRGHDLPQDLRRSAPLAHGYLACLPLAQGRLVGTDLA